MRAHNVDHSLDYSVDYNSSYKVAADSSTLRLRPRPRRPLRHVLDIHCDAYYSMLVTTCSERDFNGHYAYINIDIFDCQLFLSLHFLYARSSTPLTSEFVDATFGDMLHYYVGPTPAEQRQLQLQVHVEPTPAGQPQHQYYVSPTPAEQR